MSASITTGALQRCVPAAALLLLVTALWPAVGSSRKLAQGAAGNASDPAYLWVVDYPDTPNAAVAWAYDDEGIHADKSLSVFRPPQERGVWYTGYFPVAAHTSMLPKGTRVTLLAVTGGGQIGDAGFPLANPVGWECKWNATQDDRFFLMFMPRCPAGYVALGGCFQSQRGVTSPVGVTDIPNVVGVADAIAGALGLVDPGALAGAIDGPILSGTPTTDPDAANTINLVCVREDLVVPVGAVEVWSDKGSEAQGNGSIWVATDTDKGCAPGSMIAHSGCDQPPAYAFRRDAVILDD